MPLYMYVCPSGHASDRLRSREVETVTCDCGQTASRTSVYPINVSGFARPPVEQREIKMADYQEASAELEYRHSKVTHIDGSPLPEPRLWYAAKQRAAELQSKGVTDSLDV